METSIDSAPHGAPSTLVEGASAIRARALSMLRDVDWLGPLVGRLVVGLMFVGTGWGKVNDLGRVTEFFASLHIPWPGFQAALVGYTELVCGAALALGLLTRLATVPLIVTMVVAILTARADDVAGLFDLVALEEVTYLAVLVMLLVGGPGKVAVDRLLTSKLVASEGP
jgi:putative oxidoreductase